MSVPAQTVAERRASGLTTSLYAKPDGKCQVESRALIQWTGPEVRQGGHRRVNIGMMATIFKMSVLKHFDSVALDKQLMNSYVTTEKEEL